MSYWAKRQERIQTALADKTIAETEAQLKKYYLKTMKRVIADFETVYNKILAAIDDDREPTPADLYKLDQYWKMQAQIKVEMQKLGDQEVALLSKKFEEEWSAIYAATAMPSDVAFSTISQSGAKTMINTSWLADGKTFSQRVWGNTEKLVDTLNDSLVHCVITGKKPTELVDMLQERFNVSYNQAKTLVNTEAAHIQTQAAAARYKDYGLSKYEFLGREEHDIGCNCKKLNGKVFLYTELKEGKNAPPMHPNCRCCIIPVVDNESEEKIMNTCARCGKEIENGLKYCAECAEIKDNRWKSSAKKAGYDYDTKIDDIIRTKKSDAVFDYNYGYDGEHDNLMYYCIDCGEVFYTKGKKSTAQKRCADCQAKYRKLYKAEKERERRAKKKLNK